MNELATHFDKLLADVCSPAVIRGVETECAVPASTSSARTGGKKPFALSPSKGLVTEELWSAIASSGFLDTLVPEAQGGAGLRLPEAFELFETEGRHACPLPVAQTIYVRGELAGHGHALQDGPIAIAAHARPGANGALRCPGVPYGLVADWVLVHTAASWQLLRAADARREPSGVTGSLRADFEWPAGCEVLAQGEETGWFAAAAALTAAQLAGALARVLDITVAFANQREQFGRPIGKFQAIQHQVAVMAEHVAAARMAAEIGCASSGRHPARLRAAVAKSRTSEAAAYVAPVAHAVHGAIGITAEMDLQLYTRRIHEWRFDYGAEQHWNAVIGRALLAGNDSALDFMRHALLPTSDEIAP